MSNPSQSISSVLSPTSSSSAAGYRPADSPRRALIPSMHRRSTWHDYHGRGIYLLTLCVEGRKPILGSLIGQEVVLSPLGHAVADCVSQIPVHYPQVEVRSYVIMPDHVHILVEVHESMGKKHLGSLVSGFVYGCNCAYWNIDVASQPVATSTKQIGNTPAYISSGAISSLSSAVGYRPAVSPICPSLQSSAAGYRPADKRPSLFEKGYHDRILTHRGQLAHMIQYIQDNPRRAALKHQQPDLFRLRREVVKSNMTFSALGNLFLLDYPDKQVIEMSRSATAEQIDSCLKSAIQRAQNGSVTITAAISEGEKRIARAIREACFPLIVLLTDGFPEPGSEAERYYKPGGVYFEACAIGKLLLLEATENTFSLPIVQKATEQSLQEKALAKHMDYTPLPINSKRYRFVALNTMAKLL